MTVTNPVNYGWLAYGFFWFVGGIILIFNVQPWLTAASFISDGIVNLPFEAPILSIWGLKQVALFLQGNLISCIALVLLVLCQACQLLALCTEAPIARRFVEGSLGFKVSLDAESVEIYRRLSAAAYALELFVCFIQYPPYEGGIEAILLDLWTWDPALFRIDELVRLVVTMLSFEGALWLFLFFVTGVNPSKSHQSSNSTSTDAGWRTHRG